MKSMSASIQEPKQSILSEEALVRYYDEATKLKIDKHLTDINDTITEEDIRNINTNITLEMLVKAPNA
ncbi:MAG: hypothetical protein EOP51_18395 [Sphingobacteriales bacterium]|nr:MAG: hypothetical protein EOP51_18395 [Sphingobacteriales bacterium]